MSSRTVTVKFTANFEANLALIEAYWLEREATQAFDALLEDLASTAIGNLERHPGIGRHFFARSGQSLEVRDRVAGLRDRLGATEVREYLCGDYLLLYSVERMGRGSRAAASLHLLAIRHHRQLSFDFEGFWQSKRDDEG